jgi:hypothetical protein
MDERHHWLGIALLALSVSVPLFAARAAWAHRDDYIDETFVYMTLERGEREVELWGETRRPQAHATERWVTGAFEYGVSPRWTLDGACQFVHRDAGVQWGRVRTETRYRFAEEGRWPLDLAASAEYELETSAATGGETEHTLTPRLVVSKDLTPKLNTTVNLDVPISLSEGGASFAYAVGLRYPAESLLRVGTEVKGQPSRHTATAFPQLWVALGKETTIKVGTGIGLTDRTDRLIARAVFETEF